MINTQIKTITMQRFLNGAIRRKEIAEKDRIRKKWSIFFFLQRLSRLLPYRNWWRLRIDYADLQARGVEVLLCFYWHSFHLNKAWHDSCWRRIGKINWAVHGRRPQSGQDHNNFGVIAWRGGGPPKRGALQIPVRLSWFDPEGIIQAMENHSGRLWSWRRRSKCAKWKPHNMSRSPRWSLPSEMKEGERPLVCPFSRT